MALESILTEITADNSSLVSSGNDHLPPTPCSQLSSSVSSNESDCPVTNSLLVSSPHKLISPPSESLWNPWQANVQKEELMTTLYEACSDNDLHDVHLTAKDGSQVPASRFVLASRSPVLKRMLYGGFREAKSSNIPMLGYEKAVLRAVVEYCHSNKMPQLPPDRDLESHIRQVVRLYQSADFLELHGLGDMVYMEIRRLTGLYPGLACVVFDEVDDVSSRVGEYAKLMMEVRPYVSLGAGTYSTANRSGTPTSSTNRADLDEPVDNPHGGVECLRAERLQLVFASPDLSGGELFLFHMLRQWYDNKISYLADNVDDSDEYDRRASKVLEAALECAKHLYMENIEPAALLQIVQPCPFIHPTFLFDAFAKQALRASQHKEWALHSRPEKHHNHERVLVEDCGSKQARGMYIRMVSGLKKTNATLYTKREIVSGQPMVYTLSCSDNQEVVECRIFCSPLLTPQAVPTLYNFHATGQVDPGFKPMLQIVAIKKPSSSSKNRAPARTVVLSDGHYCIQGTLAHNMAIHNSKECNLYGVLQILAFRMYISGTSKVPKIHVQRVSVVNSDAGQVFGRPSFAMVSNKNGFSSSNKEIPAAILEDDAESHVPEAVAGEEIAELHASSLLSQGKDDDTYTAHHHAAVKDLKDVTVLYSCSYPLNKGRDNSKEGRIPKLGWQVEEAGQDPPPTCTWFAPVKKSSAMALAASAAASSVISGLSLQSLGFISSATTTASSTSNGPAASAVARGLQKQKQSSSSAAGGGSAATKKGGAMESLLQYRDDNEISSSSDDEQEEDDNNDDELSSSLSGILLSATSSESRNASIASSPLSMQI